jgi:hypothetical protein
MQKASKIQKKLVKHYFSTLFVIHVARPFINTAQIMRWILI